MENKVGGEDDEYKREGIAGSKGSIYLSSILYGIGGSRKIRYYKYAI